MDPLRRIIILLVIGLFLAGAVAALGPLAITEPRVALRILVLLLVLLLVPLALWLLNLSLRRRRRLSLVLTYLEQAVRLNLPLPQVLQSVGQSSAGRFAAEMHTASHALERGASLAAVLQAVPGMPHRILMLIDSAERGGRLQHVLSRIMNQYRDRLLRRTEWPVFYSVYPLVLGIALVGVGWLLMGLVVPKLLRVASDFEIELPRVTSATLELGRRIGPVGSLVALVAMILLLVDTIATRLELAQSAFHSRWRERLLDRLPVIGRMRGYRALSDAFIHVADGIELMRPIDEALEEAAQMTTHAPARRSLEICATAISRGTTLSDAARKAAMPSLVVGMLSLAVRTADLEHALRFLARYYATRFSRIATVLHALVLPVLAILMGIVVGWFALSLFLPLARLIDAVSPYPFAF